MDACRGCGEADRLSDVGWAAAPVRSVVMGRDRGVIGREAGETAADTDADAEREEPGSGDTEDGDREGGGAAVRNEEEAAAREEEEVAVREKAEEFTVMRVGDETGNEREEVDMEETGTQLVDGSGLGRASEGGLAEGLDAASVTVLGDETEGVVVVVLDDGAVDEVREDRAEELSDCEPEKHTRRNSERGERERERERE